MLTEDIFFKKYGFFYRIPFMYLAAVNAAQRAYLSEFRFRFYSRTIHARGFYAFT